MKTQKLQFSDIKKGDKVRDNFNEGVVVWVNEGDMGVKCSDGEIWEMTSLKNISLVDQFKANDYVGVAMDRSNKEDFKAMLVKRRTDLEEAWAQPNVDVEVWEALETTNGAPNRIVVSRNFEGQTRINADFSVEIDWDENFFETK